jgi:prepilin peptidase CpaA
VLSPQAEACCEVQHHASALNHVLAEDRVAGMILIDASPAYLTFASICSAIGAAFDVKSRRIPNLLTLPTFGLGLMLHLVLNGGRGLLSSFAGAFVCGIIFLIFYLAGGMGAGDVKLMAAVGACAGLSHVINLLVLTSLVGGAMAIFIALVHGRLKQTLHNVGTLASHHVHHGFEAHDELNVTNQETLRLPYGVAIALGCLLTLYIQNSQG